MESKIYVGGLPFKMQSEDLGKLFEEFGTVNDAFIVKDKNYDPPRSRGFGFVTFDDPEAAALAIEKKNGEMLDGRALLVQKSKFEKPSGRGGYRGRGGGYRGGSYRGSGRGYYRGGYDKPSYSSGWEKGGESSYDKEEYGGGGYRGGYDRGGYRGYGRGGYGRGGSRGGSYYEGDYYEGGYGKGSYEEKY